MGRSGTRDFPSIQPAPYRMWVADPGVSPEARAAARALLVGVEAEMGPGPDMSRQTLNCTDPSA